MHAMFVITPLVSEITSYCYVVDPDGDDVDDIGEKVVAFTVIQN